MAAAVAQRPPNLPTPTKRPPSAVEDTSWDGPDAPENTSVPAPPKKSSTTQPSSQQARPQSQQPPTPSSANVTKSAQLSKAGTARRKDSQRPADIQTGKSTKAVVRAMSTAILDPLQQKLYRRPKPCVITSTYILHKFRAEPPSLILHLHPTSFRFEQQDGSFSYSSPMRIFLEHLRSKTVPHEILDDLREGKVRFYDGCLIVEIHDHRSETAVTTARASKATPGRHDISKFSVHNYNNYLIPSPYVPYPAEAARHEDRPPSRDQPPETAVEGSTEQTAPPTSIPGASAPKRQQTRYTVVMHPTQQTRHADYVTLASIPNPGLKARRVPNQPLSAVATTPMSAAVPTPSNLVGSSFSSVSSGPPTKKQKMLIDETNIHEWESIELRVTAPALCLDTVHDVGHANQLLEALQNPSPTTVRITSTAKKRTRAEMAADEAQVAEDERYMLIMDEARSAASNAAASGPSVPDREEATYTFSRFKAYEAARKKVEEVKVEQTEKQRQRDEEQRKRSRREELDNAMLRKEQERKIAQAQLDHAMREQQNAMVDQELKRRQAQEVANRRRQQALAQQQQAMPSPSQMSQFPSGFTGMSQDSEQLPRSPSRPGSALQANGQSVSQLGAQLIRPPSLGSHQGTPVMNMATPQLQQATPATMNGTPVMALSGSPSPSIASLSTAHQAFPNGTPQMRHLDPSFQGPPQMNGGMSQQQMMAMQNPAYANELNRRRMLLVQQQQRNRMKNGALMQNQTSGMTPEDPLATYRNTIAAERARALQIELQQRVGPGVPITPQIMAALQQQRVQQGNAYVQNAGAPHAPPQSADQQRQLQRQREQVEGVKSKMNQQRGGAGFPPGTNPNIDAQRQTRPAMMGQSPMMEPIMGVQNMNAGGNAGQQPQQAVNMMNQGMNGASPISGQAGLNQNQQIMAALAAAQQGQGNLGRGMIPQQRRVGPPQMTREQFDSLPPEQQKMFLARSQQQRNQQKAREVAVQQQQMQVAMQQRQAQAQQQQQQQQGGQMMMNGMGGMDQMQARGRGGGVG